MTSFHVPYRGTTLELLITPAEAARIAQEAAWCAQRGIGFLATARSPTGLLTLSEGETRELVRQVREHLGERQAS